MRRGGEQDVSGCGNALPREEWHGGTALFGLEGEAIGHSGAPDDGLRVAGSPMVGIGRAEEAQLGHFKGSGHMHGSGIHSNGEAGSGDDSSPCREV